jgi:type IV secretory pathway ATPase VirB11/archaellum biosynthesis ATPase
MIEDTVQDAVQAAIRRRSRPGKPATTSRKTSKTDILVDMLQGSGATIDELAEATGWQAHSARAAISHILKKKMGLTVISEKVDGRGRVYRVAQ